MSDYLCPLGSLSCYPSGGIRAVLGSPIFQGVDKARELLAACFRIWTLLHYLSVSLLQLPILSKLVFYIFASLYILTTYFLTSKE